MDSYRRYNYRAYPTGEQRRALSRLYGACRFVYNWAVDQRRLMFTRHGKPQSCNQLSRMLTLLKQDPEHRWLTEVSSIPLQQAVRHADTAYRNFYRLYRARKTRIVRNERTGKRHRTGLPRYKSRRDGEQSASFTRSAGFKVEHANGCRWVFLTLPKVGRIRLRWTRDLPSGPSGVAIMLHADGSYEASFTVLVEEDAKAPEPIHEACGIDMGLDSLMSVVYDDGSREKIPHPHTLKHKTRRLRKLDKQLAREKKGSNNHAKTRLLKAKTYGRIRNQRRDMAYKLASKVAGENQAVALETLNVRGLARTRVAKSLLDANWTRIIDRIRQLGVQYGRTIIQIDRWYPSSQICSQCGHRDGRKPLDVREWKCPNCRAFLDRDWNAALNILDAAGLAESLNARGGDVRRRLAQAGRNADAREAGTRRTARPSSRPCGVGIPFHKEGEEVKVQSVSFDFE